MEWVTEIGCAYSAKIVLVSSDPAVITIQLKDYAGNALTVPTSILAYLSSDPVGLDPAATISGEVALTGSGNGAVIILLTKCAYQIISEADGTISLTITDSGTSNQYLVLVLPNGKLVVSEVLVFVT